MSRKIEKLKANSKGELVKAAQARDTSADAVPERPGMEILDDIGRGFYQSIYNETMTEADLYLLIEASFCHQQLVASRAVVAMTPAIITHANTSTGKNPIHVMHLELTRQFQTLMRDLGIRSKDGAEPNSARPTPRPQVSSTTPVDYETLRMQ